MHKALGLFFQEYSPLDKIVENRKMQRKFRIFDKYSYCKLKLNDVVKI